MTERVVRTVVCDVCEGEIGNNERYVSASTYGVDMHAMCFNNATSRDIIKILGLDEIKYMRPGDFENAQKLIYITGTIGP